MTKNVEQLTITLPKDLVERIKKLAEQKQQKVSQVVRNLVEKGMRQVRPTDVVLEMMRKGVAWERAVEGLKTDSTATEQRAKELAEKAEKYEEWAEKLASEGESEELDGDEKE